MNYTIKVYKALCSAETFKINGQDADTDDFGESEDQDRDNAPDYGCGNKVFTAKPATSAVLKKYKITVDEYNTIADELSLKLSFGRCGWCV